MKLEETENLKLQYVNRIETASTNINNIQESDTDLVEKITEILNIYEKHPNFKGKPSFKKWCNYCRRYGHSISECRQKQQDNQNKPQKYKEPNKSFYQYMKKRSKSTEQNSLQQQQFRKTTPEQYKLYKKVNHHITQVIEEDHQSEETRIIHHKITTIDQIVEITTPDHIQIHNDLFLDLIPNQEIIIIQTINHEIHHTIGIETTQIIGIEVIQTTETRITRTINQGISHIYRSNYNRPNNNYQNRSRNNSQNRHSSYNNRYRNYSQSPHRGYNNNYNNSNNRHRSSTPKHQRHINQVQSNPETTSDPPGIDDTVTDTLQLNQINCGSSDSESDAENTLSINMIKVENDYEPCYI